MWYIRSAVARAAASRSFSTAVAEEGSQRGYSRMLCLWHWTMGFGMLGTLGTVKVAQQLPGSDPNKGELMKIHKSLALCMAGMLPVRMAMRFGGTFLIPPALKSRLSHFVLYAFMIALPGSGIAMGYYGGKGIPFFDLYHVPGAPEEQKNPEIAKNAFNAHKTLGQAMTMWTCLHMGVGIGGGIARINPFL
mmetsp:Transcript_2174/g.3703  ORF Transcript_2174/g.3703 Transcript_2174/m.3703 type:complete len:191 (+) Transcript_2174:83-655(+)